MWRCQCGVMEIIEGGYKLGGKDVVVKSGISELNISEVEQFWTQTRFSI